MLIEPKDLYVIKCVIEVKGEISLLEVTLTAYFVDGNGNVAEYVENAIQNYSIVEQITPCRLVSGVLRQKFVTPSLLSGDQLPTQLHA